MTRADESSVVKILTGSEVPEEVTGEEESPSVQTTSDMVAREDVRHRFMTNFKKRDASSPYHPTHNQNATADIPDFIENDDAEKDTDLDTSVMVPPNRELAETDIEHLKQQTAHLPFETVLLILSSNDYNIQETIEEAQNYTRVDLVPQNVKDIIKANIKMELRIDPTRRDFKEFYFTKMFRGVCSTKALVEFYYSEKNKIFANLNLEDDEKPLTDSEQKELAEKLREKNIIILNSDRTLSSDEDEEYDEESDFEVETDLEDEMSSVPSCSAGEGDQHADEVPSSSMASLNNSHCDIEPRDSSPNENRFEKKDE